MKMFSLALLLLLTACSATPTLKLRPQMPPPVSDETGLRHPEVLHAYHLGRYADPEDEALMHEQHVVYRVEQSARWDLRPGAGPVTGPFSMPRDAAFAPTPINDAILAEVNSQRLATTQITTEARTLTAALAQFQDALQQVRTNLQETAALHAAVTDLKQRLDALEAAQEQPAPSASTTNAPSASLNP
jgi:hypothetical protein